MFEKHMESNDFVQFVNSLVEFTTASIDKLDKSKID